MRGCSKDGNSLVTRPAILSLGSINADFQMRVPAEIGDIETQLASDFVRLSGGKAANRAYLARRFGHPAKLFGRVGDDDLARQALGSLESDGVDLAGVSAAPRTATAVSIIVVPPSAKKRIFLASNANAQWDGAAADDLERAVASADAGSVLTVDYEAAPAEIVARALRAAVRRGVRIVADPSPGNRMDGSSIRLCAAIAPNEEEAKALTGVEVVDESSAAGAAKALAAQGAGLVCIKLANGGAMVADGSKLTLISAPDVDVVDTTGAGDAFTAALAIGLLENRPAFDAACLAVAASSMAVTKYGSSHENLVPDRIEPLVERIRRAAKAVPNG